MKWNLYHYTIGATVGYWAGTHQIVEALTFGAFLACFFGALYVVRWAYRRFRAARAAVGA